MPDEIDHVQEFNEQQFETMIKKILFKLAVTPSLFHC